jgi:hypothetical protein
MEIWYAGMDLRLGEFYREKIYAESIEDLPAFLLPLAIEYFARVVLLN